MVDILLASYNGERYIREQIESILHQDYHNIRLIVRDDGSTDRTLDIIKEYMASYPEKVVLVSDDVKCGSSVSNFMQLTQYASSEYVMYSDQDDLWLPNKVSLTLKKMKETEHHVGKNKPILVFAEYITVDRKLKEIPNSEKGSQIEKKNIKLSQLIVQNCVTGCLIMANKALYNLMGKYDKHILMHDWWCALIAAAMGEIAHIDDKVMLYRQHGDNVVGNVNVKSWNYRIKKILDKNTKNAKYAYYGQMVLFYKRYKDKLPADSKKVIKDFLKIYKTPSKLKRIYMMIKGGYLKSDLVRQLGQIWYI